MSHARLSSLLFGLFLAACGGTVEIPSSSGGADDFRNLCGGTVDMPPGSDSTGSDSTGSGGTGSAGDTGDSGSSGGAGGSASSTSSGGTPLACGGRSGGICSAEEFCDFPDDSCGTFDTEGRCLPLPGGCPKDCPGVCGCDHQFYCNACAAQQAGVDVLEGTSCGKPEVGTYTATFWPGGLDHLTLYKGEPEADRCVILYADAPVEPGPGLEIVTRPESWNVSRIVMSKGAADCAPSTTRPAGESVLATGATGVLTMDLSSGTAVPCTVDVDITVTFPEEPATAQLRATGVVVDEGCR
ncbi:hypothetical protein WME90_24735 [Sorangium sp. So ce375]|uniref:hypothetical protein n=1 Tax=Sorangium sp. So ce375 TaxID=3133306 RepID=UPI003F5C0CE5